MIRIRHKLMIPAVGAALAAGALAACDQRDTTSSPHAAAAAVPAAPVTSPSYQVTIDNFTFSPQTLTVPAGTTITWVNHDDVPHTVVSSVKPRLFASAAMDTDDNYSHVFTTPGTYAYFCGVHPHMTGRIVVK